MAKINVTQILFTLLASIGMAAVLSCSDEENEIEETVTIQEKVIFQDCYTDDSSTALEKALAYIDSYNTENDIHTRTSVITFVSNIDDCPVSITQSTVQNTNRITQKLTTYCKVKTSYRDDYIPSPDYLSRHYTRTLCVSHEEILQTVIRQSSNNGWSDWTHYTNYHKSSSNHAKNIAVFGGSFAHNLRDGGEGEDRFGFNYNGKITSLMDLFGDVFASRHIGNYAQGGQGVHTGMLNNAQSFKYNMYEQIKYAIEFSKEKGYDYDVFLLFGGINDCAKKVPMGDIGDPAGDNSYIASFKKVIEYIKACNPEASIYLITSFPVFRDPETYRLLNEYVNANLRLAEYYKLPVLDIYNYHIFTNWNYGPYYLSDKIHPNGEGYRIVSSYIIDLLNE